MSVAGSGVSEPPLSISIPVTSLEGNFTSWSTVLFDGSLGVAQAGNVQAGGVWIDEITGFVYMWDITAGNSANAVTKATTAGGSFGALIAVVVTTPVGASVMTQSLTGKYVIFNETTAGKATGKIDILKDGALQQTIDKSASFITTGGGVVTAISNSGKFIAIFGEDSASSTTKHLVVLQGS